tara:strand:+ start:871 stop:1125 length:255 start_codon:yes stop_codon:yes gene_type:complete
MKSKIKFSTVSHWSGTHFKVYLDGKKYPLERGEFYQPPGETDSDKRKKAAEWALAERDGKYLSKGGIIYSSKDEYLKIQNQLNS